MKSNETLNVNVEEPTCGFLLREIKYNSALCKNMHYLQCRSTLILSCVKKTILDCRVSAAAAADKFKIVISCSIFACNWPNYRVYCSTFLRLQSTNGADFYKECIRLVLFRSPIIGQSWRMLICWFDQLCQIFIKSVRLVLSRSPINEHC